MENLADVPLFRDAGQDPARGVGTQGDWVGACSGDLQEDDVNERTDADLIVDWTEIGSGQQYVVFPINAASNGSLYLGQPSTMMGWEVTRLMQGAYGAILAPGLTAKTLAGLERIKLNRIIERNA